MRIQKVKDYRTPQYPTKELFINKPALLSEYAPPSWKIKAAVAGALMAFAFFGGRHLLMERDNIAKKFTIIQKIGVGREIVKKLKSKVPVTNKTDAAYRIAPVFCRGNGIGFIGCIVVTPPTFIGEDSARWIIEDEFGRENIFFDNNDVRIMDEQQHCITLDLFEEEAGLGQKFYDENPGKDGKPLTIDGFNKEFNLGYIYISKNDFEDIVSNPQSGSVMEWNTKEVAMYMRDRMEKTGKLNAVVFYDPIGYIESDESDKSNDNFVREEIGNLVRQMKASKKSEELLRQQVKDFLEWAEYEGLLDKLKRAR